MTLPDLITRLEQAEGGSRELDTEVWFEIGWNGQGDGRPVPPLTTSVDAALDLIGERLPGAYGRIEPRFYEPEDVRWIGYTIRPHWDRWSPVSDDWFDVSEARASTPAISLCLALCRALQSQDTPNEG